MLILYKIITILARPLIYLYVLIRKFRGKEDPKRYTERFGYHSLPRPDGTLILVHTASVGELISVLPLISELRLQKPAAYILVTTVTLSSARILQDRTKGDVQILHQYLPVDEPVSITRFLSHWKPDLFLLVESEIWPNLLTHTKAYCPMILVNARISNKSFARWHKYFLPLAKPLFALFDLILPQSLRDEERTIALGGQNVRFVGNLKYSAPPLAAPPEKLELVKQQIGERKTLLIASTHGGEEEIIAQIFIKLKEQYPDLLLIIAPRHTNRATEIIELLQTLQLTVAQRSAAQEITAQTDVYLADTLGELGIFYSLSSFAFIGGSLIPIGGHNPVEPIKCGCKPIMGPYTHSFTEICQDLLAKNMLIVAEQEQLYEVFLQELKGQIKQDSKQLIDGDKILQDMMSNILTYYKSSTI
jgi:3-deoxy-D-manno-octulosonic-acid transferase